MILGHFNENKLIIRYYCGAIRIAKKSCMEKIQLGIKNDFHHLQCIKESTTLANIFYIIRFF